MARNWTQEFLFGAEQYDQNMDEQEMAECTLKRSGNGSSNWRI